MPLISLMLGVSLAAEPALGLNHAVMEAVRDHVSAVKNMDVADVEVGAVGLDLTTPCEGSIDVSVRSLPGEQFRGLTHLRIELVSSAKLCGQYTISPRIELYSDVPVAAEAYDVGDDIGYRTKRMSMASVRGAVIDPTEGPFVAIRPIAAGEPLTHRRVKRRPAALLGEGVDIVVLMGGLTITAEGRMLADAYLGDRVRVANLATDTVVQGTLTKPGIVSAGGR